MIDVNGESLIYIDLVAADQTKTSDFHLVTHDFTKNDF
jgi:hypothetical protein